MSGNDTVVGGDLTWMAPPPGLEVGNVWECTLPLCLDEGMHTADPSTPSYTVPVPGAPGLQFLGGNWTLWQMQDDSMETETD